MQRFTYYDDCAVQKIHLLKQLVGQTPVKPLLVGTQTLYPRLLLVRLIVHLRRALRLDRSPQDLDEEREERAGLESEHVRTYIVEQGGSTL